MDVSLEACRTVAEEAAEEALEGALALLKSELKGSGDQVWMAVAD